MTPDIAVVYLARCADGFDAFVRFVNSYLNHPAGINHKLVVIYKGFESSESLDRAKLIFGGVPHDLMLLDDVGFDIGSYFEASRVITSEYLCFLNTHSEISADNWLKLMMQAAVKGDVGLTGAMGSYESIKDSVNLYRWVILESMGTNLEVKKFIAKHFDYVLSRYHKNWFSGNSAEKIEKEQAYLIQRIGLFIKKIFFIPGFSKAGTQSIWLTAPKFEYGVYPSFPNPHIRSNGFIVRNLIFRSLIAHNLIRKADANLFESGPKSMTNVIKGLGLKAVIVGKNGEIYDEEDWWNSDTFRQGNQSNLLISDNHVRAYMDMTEPSRESHYWLTWGSSKKTKRPTVFDYKNKI